MKSYPVLFRTLAGYYGMTVDEFLNLINGDTDKLSRFIYDFNHNHR